MPYRSPARQAKSHERRGAWRRAQGDGIMVPCIFRTQFIKQAPALCAGASGAVRAFALPTDAITLIAPGGIRAPIQKMIPDIGRRIGCAINATFGSGNVTKQRVMQGEVFDVPIVQPPLAEVIATGHVVAATETPLATVGVAVAVRRGAAKPDISTPDAVRRMLLAAKSVAIPDGARGAAAGVSLDETLRKLGIVDRMKSTLRRVPGGTNTMVALARGEVEIGLTFLSEIHEPGVEVVGILPRAISMPTGLVAYIHAQSKAPESAKALLTYLASPEAATVYNEMGMQPGR